MGVIFIVDDIFQIDAWIKERNLATVVVHTEKQSSHHCKTNSALDDLDKVEFSGILTDIMGGF